LGKEEEEKTEQKADEWEIKGWVRLSKSKTVINVFVGDDLVGSCNKATMQKVLDEKVDAVPIKKPPVKEEE